MFLLLNSFLYKEFVEKTCKTNNNWKGLLKRGCLKLCVLHETSNFVI